MVIVIFVGILAALSLPTMRSFLSRQRVNDGLAKVRAALQNTQREAMRRGQACTVNIPDGGNTITGTCLQGADSSIGGNPAFVLPPGTEVLNNIPGGGAVTYTFRGRNIQAGTIRIRATDGGTDMVRCAVLSLGVGVLRSGNYVGSSCVRSDL